MDYYKLNNLKKFFSIIKENALKADAHLIYGLNYALSDLLLNFIEKDKLEFCVVDPTLIYQIEKTQLKEFLEIISKEFQEGEFYEGCELLKAIIPMCDTEDFTELKDNLDLIKKYKGILDNVDE